MPTKLSITDAVELLRSGGVVGMPTETVYGLAADARREDAVTCVFRLKGRPSTNPLIVHVASSEVAERYAVVDERARSLFRAFSPGPLTIVLPLRVKAELRLPLPLGEGGGEGLSGSNEFRNTSGPHPNPLPEGEGTVARLVTAGLHTVGIRIPDHPLALELLRAFDGPLAAPSANRSNHVSPTTADHVRAEFGVDFPVLDGGPCQVGIESTVLSLATPTPTILRPGSITREAIEAIIGRVELFAGHVAVDIAAASPGQQAKHYAPRSPAFRCEGDLFRALVNNRARAALPLNPDPSEAARLFYASLRAIDERSPDFILIEMPPDEPRWTALRDRITRATRPWSERGS